MRRLLSVTLLVVMTALMILPGCSRGPKSDKNGTAPATAPGSSQTGAGSNQTAAGSAQPDRSGWPVIVAFGDSLTFGLGVPYEKNYPSVLQTELDKLGYRYRVVNAGISGDTTAGGLARVETVLTHKPKVVILELGANDGLRGQPVDKMKANLAAMIERFQKAGVTVVLAGIQIPPNYGPDYTREFKQAFFDLAESYKVPFIPFILEGVAADPKLNQPDGIHPTAEGYPIILRKNILPVLLPLLQK